MSESQGDIDEKMARRIAQLQHAMTGETLRGQIIISATHIDEVLKEMLKRMMKPLRGKDEDELFRPMGPLESFTTRIALAYRIGLISEDDAEAFDMLRKVRNDCAHTITKFSHTVEPHKGRLSRFVEFTCRDFHRAIGLGGLVCPQTNEEWVLMACMIHIFCLEVTLSKITQLPDGFWVGAAKPSWIPDNAWAGMGPQEPQSPQPLAGSAPPDYGPKP